LINSEAWSLTDRLLEAVKTRRNLIDNDDDNGSGGGGGNLMH
jgi:hypothetical protein